MDSRTDSKTTNHTKILMHICYIYFEFECEALRRAIYLSGFVSSQKTYVNNKRMSECMPDRGINTIGDCNNINHIFCDSTGAFVIIYRIPYRYFTLYLVGNLKMGFVFTSKSVRFRFHFNSKFHCFQLN